MHGNILHILQDSLYLVVSPAMENHVVAKGSAPSLFFKVLYLLVFLVLHIQYYNTLYISLLIFLFNHSPFQHRFHYFHSKNLTSLDLIFEFCLLFHSSFKICLLFSKHSKFNAVVFHKWLLFALLLSSFFLGIVSVYCSDLTILFRKVDLDLMVTHGNYGL